MFFGCGTYELVRTKVDGISSQEYMNILGLKKWSGIMRHFRNKNFLIHDDYATVHSSYATQIWKTENKNK